MSYDLLGERHSVPCASDCTNDDCGCVCHTGCTMTKTGAKIIKELFDRLIYAYRKHSANRDTLIFNKLMEAYNMFVKEYNYD